MARVYLTHTRKVLPNDARFSVVPKTQSAPAYQLQRRAPVVFAAARMTSLRRDKSAGAWEPDRMPTLVLRGTHTMRTHHPIERFGTFSADELLGLGSSASGDWQTANARRLVVRTHDGTASQRLSTGFEHGLDERTELLRSDTLYPQPDHRRPH